jgi:hypothetical protein
MPDELIVIPETVDDAAERRREYWKLAQRKKRARIAEEKRVANSKSVEEFWTLNRAQLKPAELKALLERQDAVLQLCEMARDYVEGKFEVLDDDDRTWLTETVAQVRQTGWFDEFITWVPFHTPAYKEFFNEVVQRGGATATYAKFGIFAALPSNVYESFRKRFMVKPSVPQKAYWELIRCTCGTEDNVPVGTADAYTKARKNYWCHRCREAERRSRKIAEDHTATTRDGSYPYDKWGRVIS